MKNKLFTIISLLIALIFLANSIKIVSAVCAPNIQIVNQDPIPAVPNDYVKIVLEVSNLNGCDQFAVDLNPTYPFSLDPGTDPIQVIQQSPYSPGYKSTWDIPYKVRVAGDALDGDYDLKLLYHIGSSRDFSSNYLQQDLNVSVVGSQTDFSTVIQGVSSNQVSIGIVNIGKNTANSLIVSIPNQNTYTATGTTQQIVGNLNAGDYSIVTFNIASRNAGAGSRNFTRSGTGEQVQNPNVGGASNASSGNNNPNIANFANQTIKIQLDYTDGIGIRRTLTKEIPFSLASFSLGNSTSTGNFTRRTGTNSSSGISIWWYIGGIIVILIILFIIYRKYSDNIKHFFKKKHNEKSSKNTPEWVLAERTHHKK